MQFLTARKMIVPDAMMLYDNYYRFVRRHPELISGNRIFNSEVGIRLLLRHVSEYGAWRFIFSFQFYRYEKMHEKLRNKTA